MASLNHKFAISERRIFLRNWLDSHFCKSAGVLPVVSRRQHLPVSLKEGTVHGYGAENIESLHTAAPNKLRGSLR